MKDRDGDDNDDDDDADGNQPSKRRKIGGNEGWETCGFNGGWRDPRDEVEWERRDRERERQEGKR